MSLAIIILIILGVVIFGVIFIYNRLIGLRNQVQEAWSDIEVQLKRRYNLIPNLVNTVKGYASHEKEVFEKVTEARSKAMQVQGIDGKVAAEGELSNALKSLFAVAENYPQLRASENFQKLQDELTDTEDKIQAARRFYNGIARDYNIAQQAFPNNLIAGSFHFKSAEFFGDVEKEERKVPDVKF
ncbi:MAG TPA: LemA family protein [Candidatus Portnoybacteria bacterium]|nr:LemA family protein [Candidatus Portnoybacteria bacterium]